MAKETGWSEQTILDMPLGRVWSYRHAILRHYEVATFFLTDDEERKEIQSLFAKLTSGGE